MHWENDAFAGIDRDYSNGTALSLLLRGRGLLEGFWTPLEKAIASNLTLDGDSFQDGPHVDKCP